jgi:hypothetical protein
MSFARKRLLEFCIATLVGVLALLVIGLAVLAIKLVDLGPRPGNTIMISSPHQRPTDRMRGQPCQASCQPFCASS